jgi:polar amino acid transport system substrate-binding protein
MMIRWTKLLTVSMMVSVITIFWVGGMNLHAAEKTYIAGIEAAFPPWAYAEKGEYKGIAVDAMREIAKISGIKVEFKDLEWPSLIPALGKGKIDLLVTGLSVTCERDKIIDYSIPWWEINQEILIKKDSNKNAITAMCCGATVASQAGSTAFDWIEKNLKEKGVKIKHVGYEDYVTAVEDLIIGRVDSVLCDTDTSLQFIAEGRPIEDAGTINVREPYALAVTGGDPHKLLPILNKGIMELYKSGKWAEIVHKYMPGAPIKNIPAFMPDCIETYKAPIPGL